MMRASDIHARIGAGWPWILEQLGIDASYLRNVHGPCPACGGKDRFRFPATDQHGRHVGAWYCSQCGGRDGNGGPGDGFALLQRVHRWSFAEARRRVVGAAGLEEQPAQVRSAPPVAAPPPPERLEPTGPPPRALKLLRTSCEIADCPTAVNYLQSRGLWPLPEGTTLRAHVGAEYWHERQLIGRYAALVAPLVALDGELAAVHVTYLQADGRKLDGHAPRKLHGKLGGLDARRGLAVRLMPPAGDVLGIAEGIETAIAASILHRIPTWAALTADLLAHFCPPPAVHSVVTFADADVAGLKAAYALREQLDGRAQVELCLPPAPAADWNDALVASLAHRFPTAEAMP